MAKPKVTMNSDPHQESKFPQSIASGAKVEQPKVRMFEDGKLSSCKNRTNVGEGSSSKPSL